MAFGTTGDMQGGDLAPIPCGSGANNCASGAAIKESPRHRHRVPYTADPHPGGAHCAGPGQPRAAASSDAPIITTPLAVSTTSTTRRKAVALRPR